MYIFKAHISLYIYIYIYICVCVESNCSICISECIY